MEGWALLGAARGGRVAGEGAVLCPIWLGWAGELEPAHRWPQGAPGEACGLGLREAHCWQVSDIVQAGVPDPHPQESPAQCWPPAAGEEQERARLDRETWGCCLLQGEDKGEGRNHCRARRMGLKGCPGGAPPPTRPSHQVQEKREEGVSVRPVRSAGPQAS